MNRKKLWLESLFITILNIIVLYIFYLMLNISFKPLNYIVNTIADINLNDLYFSNVANNTVDTNIVIVNVEDLDRRGIAELIDKLSQGNPAAIGLDVFFSKHLETPDDSLLAATLLKHRNIIVNSAPFSDKKIPDTNFWILPEVCYGHAGILSDENKTETVREFEPFLSGTTPAVWSFATRLVEKVKPEKVNQLIKRDNATEKINYIGSLDAFMLLHYSEIIEMTPADLDMLNGKILLLGYCGDPLQKLTCFNDIFYTPVGFNLSVNRHPDMYGIVIHANIVSMIMNNHYISNVQEVIVYVISFILIFLHVLMFTWLYLKTQILFQGLSLLIQCISLTLVLWLAFLLFSKYSLYFPTAVLLASIALIPNVINIYEVIVIFAKKAFKWQSLFHPESNT